MNFEPNLILYLSAAVVFLGLALAVITVAFIPTLRWIYSSFKEENKQKEEVRKEGAAVLAAALAEAQTIMAAAKEESHKMIERTQTSDEEARTLWHQSLQAVAEQQRSALEKVTTQFLVEFRHSLEGAEQNNLARFRKVADEIGSGAVAELSGFEGALRNELLRAQQKLTERIEESYVAAQKEIDDYKASQLKKLDAAIYRIILQVSEKVMGKVLNLQEHQELVRHSLDDITRHEITQP